MKIDNKYRVLIAHIFFELSKNDDKVKMRKDSLSDEVTNYFIFRDKKEVRFSFYWDGLVKIYVHRELRDGILKGTLQFPIVLDTLKSSIAVEKIIEIWHLDMALL